MTLHFVFLFCMFHSLFACEENCNAYTTRVDSPSYFGNYNLFYLYNGNKSDCKHCFFDIKANDSTGNHYFNIGLYNNALGEFSSLATGYLYATTGFDTCEYGYCAIWFDTSSFTSFTIQQLPISSKDYKGGDCYFNNTFCTGSIPGYLSFTHISSSINYDISCEL